MCIAWVSPKRYAWLPLLLLAACASVPVASARDIADASDTGRRLGANNEADRALLREVATLPSGAPRRVGNNSVVAEAPYDAASGRSCRALHVTAALTQEATHRLACNDGKIWFFVPDVFGQSGSTE